MSTQTVTLHTGDSRQVLRTLPENSVDAIVTDPPYELGFMGKAWDRSGIANDVKFWDDCLRVLKPGGHLLAFSGSRTYHRMTCAIEDAGFEVRDQMMWVYGSGFPKSHNVGKALDKEAGANREVIGVQKNAMQGWSSDGKTKFVDRDITAPATDLAKQWDGWGTALKPAHEPICVARKPLDGTVAENIRKWGVGGLNIDGCRVGTDGGTCRDGKGTMPNDQGWENMKGHGIEKLNAGRWPANLMHDGSDEVLGLFPKNAGAAAPVKSGHSGESKNGIYHDYATRGDDGATFYADSGSAARFFYCPKASKRDRDEGLDGFEEKNGNTWGDGVGHSSGEEVKRRNIHPTVKPTELMRYLCRLVTPPGGTVLDPFLGSGSTGKAAVLEGFSFIGIDLSPEYAAIAKARIDHALANR